MRARLPAFLLLSGPVLWNGAALWYDGPDSRMLAGALATVCVGGLLAVLFVINPVWKAAVSIAVACGIVTGWWLTIEPRNDRQWQRDVAELSTAAVSGDRIEIHHLRNFDYRSETDYTVRWESRTYDLSKLRGLDLFISYWGPRAIAHTILSWQFEDAPPLAISIETRKEEGEDYSAVRGFFRQYELYYVVADERDVIRVRTNARGEEVYLYRLRTPPARARALLLEYLAKVNRLAATPDWYNAFTQNCTTAVFLHIRDLGIPFDWSWKIFLNGYLDEQLYGQSVINTSLTFEQVRTKSAISSVARRVAREEDFAAAIRAGLPDRPLPPVYPERGARS